MHHFPGIGQHPDMGHIRVWADARETNSNINIGFTSRKRDINCGQINPVNRTETTMKITQSLVKGLAVGSIDLAMATSLAAQTASQGVTKVPRTQCNLRCTTGNTPSVP